MASDIWREVQRRRSVEDRLALRNTTAVADLLTIFDPDDVRQLNEYQEARVAIPRALLDNPLGDEFVGKYGAPTDRHPEGTTHLFTHNRASYEDDVEGQLDQDPVVVALRSPETGRGHNAEEVMDAVRARRTAVAFLMNISVEAPDQVAPPVAGVPGEAAA